MKTLLSIIVIFFYSFCGYSQSCMSLFSYGANFETVNFYNQSQLANAHYWWNFGDGTGSNYSNPVHTYPETGKYLATLFVKDTINNCSDYYELWLNITKYSTDTCQPSITDSIFIYNSNYYLKIIDNSVNCNGYNSNYDGGPAQNFPPNNWISLSGGWQHARFLSRVQYYTYDTINGYIVHREAYKSSPFLYTSSKNYGDCSANFEFNVVSQDTAGQTILFKAMNNSATSYKWNISGFGNPIISTNDTISKYYPYSSNSLWLVGLYTVGSTGCKDTLFQQILIRSNDYTTVGLDDLQLSTKEKILIKITDLMGRETKEVPNTPLIYIYSDGTIERIFRME